MDASTDVTRNLMRYVQKCPTSYHAIAHTCQTLDQHGFARLCETDSWRIEPGAGYYVVRNDSSVVAFRVGDKVEAPRFNIVTSHSDSPTFKVKAQPMLEGPGTYLRLNVEAYGGLIDRTWLDRPLSIAGRVIVQDGIRLSSQLLCVDRDLLLIPSVAIHLDRDAKETGRLRRHVDLCPLFSDTGLGGGSFDEFIAKELGIQSSQVLAYDLFLYNRQAPSLWGANQEFVSASRLDDLQCAHASYEAFLDASNDGVITVCACFDSEEVGSGTMQGALSTFLPDVLRRICNAMGYGADEYRQALARSFVVSCDNAHAVHPSHPELCDEGNRVWLNRGVVVKEAANQRYTTDALSRAIFEKICRDADVPVQRFANRSDMAGGSTLGHLLTQQVSVHAVDVGLPQLAMHSCYETAGAHDSVHLIKALRAFFQTRLTFQMDGSMTLG